MNTVYICNLAIYACFMTVVGLCVFEEVCVHISPALSLCVCGVLMTALAYYTFLNRVWAGI